MSAARCNVLPFPVPHRQPDARRAFRLAYCRHAVAECEYRLAEAERALAQALGEDREAAERGRRAFWQMHDRYREAALAFAWTPAPDKRALDSKRRAIGGVWLKAEGEFFDDLRAGLAADQRRLDGLT